MLTNSIVIESKKTQIKYGIVRVDWYRLISDIERYRGNELQLRL